MIIWFVGLSGSGKTTFSTLLYNKIKSFTPSTVLLDGDTFREIMNNDLTHTLKDREINGRRICNLCKFLDDQNINVVTAILSNFIEHQDWNRENFKNYKQVYIKTSEENLMRFGKKSIYTPENKQNVIGWGIPFNEPLNSDIIIENQYDNSHAAHLTDEIFEKIKGDLC